MFKKKLTKEYAEALAFLQMEKLEETISVLKHQNIVQKKLVVILSDLRDQVKHVSHLIDGLTGYSRQVSENQQEKLMNRLPEIQRELDNMVGGVHEDIPTLPPELRELINNE